MRKLLAVLLMASSACTAVPGSTHTAARSGKPWCEQIAHVRGVLASLKHHNTTRTSAAVKLGRVEGAMERYDDVASVSDMRAAINTARRVLVQRGDLSAVRVDLREAERELKCPRTAPHDLPG